MDLGEYIQRSNKKDIHKLMPGKKCLNCGNSLEKNEKNYLYYQRFCSEKCKEKYISQ